jgi:hypothetical protein
MTNCVGWWEHGTKAIEGVHACNRNGIGVQFNITMTSKTTPI